MSDFVNPEIPTDLPVPDIYPVHILDEVSELPQPVQPTPTYQPPTLMQTFAMQTLGGVLTTVIGAITVGVVTKKMQEHEARKARKAAEKEAARIAEEALAEVETEAEPIKAEIV